MLYRLSKIIPVPMHLTYTAWKLSFHNGAKVDTMHLERAQWWQWRGRIWRYRRSVIDA